MIKFITELFSFSGRLFSWMPYYLYKFVCTALNVAGTILLLVIALKLLAFGIDLIKTLRGAQ